MPVEALLAALRQWPYSCLVRCPGDAADRSFTPKLLRAAAAATGQSASQSSCFTRVRVDPEKAAGRPGSTSLSRTHLALPLHTDDSYMRRPREMVAFQMVREDADRGGMSLLATVEDLVARLPGTLRIELEKPNFKFGRECYPILRQGEDGYRMRYYRAQLDSMPAAEHSACRALLNQLDDALRDSTLAHSLHLPAGTVLIMNNSRVLHGRAAMSSQSDRLIYRFRVRANGL